MSERRPAPTTIRLIDQIPSLRGHFCVEPGYHAPFGLDLEPFVKSPERVASRVALLAERLRPYEPEGICAPPMVGGPLAIMIAAALGVRFHFSFPVPRAKRRDPRAPEFMLVARPPELAGKRIAVIDAAITEGTELRALRQAVVDSGAEVPVVGALLVLGQIGIDAFAARGIALEALEREPCDIWPEADCPLCSAGEPVVDILEALWGGRDTMDVGEPRSVKSATEKIIALVSAPTFDEAGQRQREIVAELEMNRAGDPWIRAAVALRAEERLSIDETIFLVRLITKVAPHSSTKEDRELNRLYRKMGRIGRDHGIEDCFSEEAKRLPALAELHERWDRKVEEFKIAHWRSLGAEDAADLLERSPDEFDDACDRGMDELRGRWPADTDE